jgi:hypothetical protein
MLDKHWNESKKCLPRRDQALRRTDGISRCRPRRLLRRRPSRSNRPNDRRRNCRCGSNGNDLRRRPHHCRRRSPLRSYSAKTGRRRGGYSATGHQRAANQRRAADRDCECRHRADHDFTCSQSITKVRCCAAKQLLPAMICHQIWQVRSLIIQAGCGTFAATDCLSTVFAP